MLTRNNIFPKTKELKSEMLIKRRYSKINDSNNSLEPIKKLRQLKEKKIDDNIDENDKNDEYYGGEFKDFIKTFAIPSNIYKYLSIHRRLNPVMLNRNLSFNQSFKNDFSKSNIKSIADHLATVRFHDENIPLIKSKSPILNKSNVNMTFILTFEQFMDNKIQKDWKTIEADIYVDILHLYKNNRKNKNGFITNRIINKKKINCNTSGQGEGFKYTLDIKEVMTQVSSYRVYKSLLHFKILAKEKKLFIKNISQDKKCEDLFPVTYEAMMPFFHNRDEQHMYKESCYVQAGKYEIFPRITNMERCDDSMYNGEMKKAYNCDGENFDNLNCYWAKVDDIQNIDTYKNNARLVFYIFDDKTAKTPSKVLKSRNKSLPPIVKLSPKQNQDFCLASVRINKQLNIDVNIAFKFLIQDKVVQWTKSSSLSCPWCQRNFNIVSDLYETMMKMLDHLNYMHPRFTFRCKKLISRSVFTKSLPKKFITVDVTLTDVISSDLEFGLVVSGDLPIRRSSLTEVVHSKYQQPIPNLHREHHTRDYCHTWSSRKNKYFEFEIDSEAEENMGWLYDHYSRKVEEFSDLNNIEKRVIQIWNESLLKYGVSLGDWQMATFVERFIWDIIDNKEKLKEVKLLRNTLMLHLVTLVDFGVLPPLTMLKSMKSLDFAIQGLP